jgi:hypothetical protein
VDPDEARRVLASALETARRRGYAALRRMAEGGEVETREVAGASGARYQLELSVVWENREPGDLRLFGSIDDGGWRAFFPLTDSVVIAPDGPVVE